MGRIAADLTGRGHRVELIDLPTDQPGLLAAAYARPGPAPDDMFGREWRSAGASAAQDPVAAA